MIDCVKCKRHGEPAINPILRKVHGWTAEPVGKRRRVEAMHRSGVAKNSNFCLDPAGIESRKAKFALPDDMLTSPIDATIHGQ